LSFLQPFYKLEVDCGQVVGGGIEVRDVVARYDDVEMQVFKLVVCQSIK
jgi:hypothetical protein